jgi:hypothetical protein
MGAPPLLAEPTPAVGLGQAWARSFSKTPLSAADQRAVGEAYARRTARAPARVFERFVAGRREVIGHLGLNGYAVVEGQLWVFPLTAPAHSDTWQTIRLGPAVTAAPLGLVPQAIPGLIHAWTEAELWAAFAARDLTVQARDWLLTSYCAGAAKLAAAWADADLNGAFWDAGIPGGTGTSPDSFTITAEQMRYLKAYTPTRQRHYLARIGTALKPLRDALPKEVVSTLWSVRLTSGEFAHWALQAATPTALTYRLQALRAQPLWLPIALRRAGRLPGVNARVERAPGEEGTLAFLTRSLRAPLTTLEQAIDGGQSWTEALLALLQTSFHQDLSTLPAAPSDRPLWAQTQKTIPVHLATSMRELDPIGDLNRLTLKDLTFLSGRRPRQTLLYNSTLAFVRQSSSYQDEGPTTLVVTLTQTLRGLSGNRRPRAKAHWDRLMQVVRFVQQHAPQLNPATVVEPLLRGLPLDWDDPKVEILFRRFNLISDSLHWMLGAHAHVPLAPSAQAAFAVIFQRLSLVQLANFSDRAHAIVAEISEEMRQEEERTHETLKTLWAKIRTEFHWSTVLAPEGEATVHGVRFTDLTSWKALQHEGQRQEMNHCVGKWEYAYACARGRSRILSLRSTTGAHRSTAEIGWDPQRQRPIVKQHWARNDTPPAPELEKALKQFLAHPPAGWVAGPWATVAEAETLAYLQGLHARQDPTVYRNRIMADFERRYGAVAPALHAAMGPDWLLIPVAPAVHDGHAYDDEDTWEPD